MGAPYSGIMQINQPIWVIGLMSGTSVDGIDAALICTDGEQVAAHGASHFVPYEAALASQIHALMKGEGDRASVEHAITLAHVQAVEALIAKAPIPRAAIQLIGFHGQTIHHDPANGITVQLGDGALLASRTGTPVVNDFRTRDVAEGGQGAPLVPLYHRALAEKLPRPLAVLNLGGVANITWLGHGTQDIIALDSGPGNALMDDVVRKATGKTYDENGAMAAVGSVHDDVVARYMAHAFFEKPAPKSLDRNQFSLALVEGLKPEDALATLAAFTVAATAHELSKLPDMPRQLLVTGGGRHNATLMQLLAARLNMPVEPVEAVHWNGDMLEAEAFAYLAARSVRGLPLSLPTTTGVPRAVTGGAFYRV